MCSVASDEGFLNPSSLSLFETSSVLNRAQHKMPWYIATYSHVRDKNIPACSVWVYIFNGAVTLRPLRLFEECFDDA